MAIAAIASGVAALLPLAGKIENQKDPERFATAQTLYYAARAGDADALCQLKYLSGRYGTSPGCGKYGAGTSGFATNVAKQYAFDLYTQAQSIIDGNTSPAAPIPSTPSPGSAVNVPGVIQGISNVSSATGAVASAAGAPNVQEKQRNLALLALAVVVAIIVLKKVG